MAVVTAAPTCLGRGGGVGACRSCRGHNRGLSELELPAAPAPLGSARDDDGTPAVAVDMEKHFFRPNHLPSIRRNLWNEIGMIQPNRCLNLKVQLLDFSKIYCLCEVNASQTSRMFFSVYLRRLGPIDRRRVHRWHRLARARPAVGCTAPSWSRSRWRAA